MLDAIIERLEGCTELQSAVGHVVRASDDALPAFEQLADGRQQAISRRTGIGRLLLPASKSSTEFLPLSICSC